MIVLVYLIVLLRELLVSTIKLFCIVHPTSPLNDFYTYILLCVENAVTRMRTLTPRLAGFRESKMAYEF